MERNNKLVDEVDSWKKTLVFLQQENAFQKNKLGEILKNEENDPALLETAEQYQNQFLQHDETFKLMWVDLADLEKSIQENIIGKKHNGKETSSLQKKLKTELKTLDDNFKNLRDSFNKFLNNFFEETFTDNLLKP